MRSATKAGILSLACALCVSVAGAQQYSGNHSAYASRQPDESQTDTYKRSSDFLFTEDDGLAVIAAAMDSRTLRHSGDCSHLVQAIYRKAGFPYEYATSNDLFTGVEGFERVRQPQPGDLVVWRGHVGIVIRPSRHVFFSFKHAGPGIDDYSSHYWSGRGRPRFYRYVKNDPCAGCMLRAHNSWKSQ